MTTITLKKNLHKFIDEINDVDYLKSIYTILSDKFSDVTFEYSDDMKKMLEERKQKHLRGEGKLYTWNEGKRKILRGR
ncbi:hypothetical protein BH11BAC1_BH11BAC1_08470 [soil metagenome]